MIEKAKELRTKMKETFRTGGLKGLFRAYGWRLVAGVFVYYLVRDSVIYIVLPWLIARNVVLK